MAQNNTDYTKPIFIAAGKDSFSHIFAASDKALGFKSWTNWKEEIFKVFSGDEEPVSANLIPLNEDKHPDIFLDNLKSQKENEIELLKEEFNQSVRNAKLAAK